MDSLVNSMKIEQQQQKPVSIIHTLAENKERRYTFQLILKSKILYNQNPTRTLQGK